ncbi:MAG: hypothetical protein AAFU64_07135 [Bacteroidota bacterium]
MEENKSTPLVSDQRSIQDYLSLGYLYLLIVGITNDSIYYGMVGVNILSYSSLLDVLISPISYLTRSIYLTVTIFSIPTLFLLFVRYNRRRHFKYRDELWYQRKHNVEKIDQSYANKNFQLAMIGLTGLFIFSAYIGLGIGAGYKNREYIQSGDMYLGHEITFMDGKKISVKLIGHNSLYAFYVLKNNKEVTIAPIQGNIRSIKRKENADPPKTKKEKPAPASKP